jgi:hypothetical protein
MAQSGAARTAGDAALMGREALIHVEVGNEAAEVKALLEAHELILRGEIKRRFTKAAMERLAVEREALCFVANGEAVRLHLGAKMATNWMEAILKPPASLRAKLGLDNGAMALLVGVHDDAALAEATEGALVTGETKPDMLLALVDSEADLDHALEVQSNYTGLPIWAIYPKGKAAKFGDTAIRTKLRAAGFRDTKSCAVSDRLTATRYNVA